MSKHSFEFTTGGIAALGDAPGENFGITPANPDMFKRPDQAQPAPAVVPRSREVVPTKKPLNVANVVKAAKARRTELKREIARLRKLEVELAELERLLAAAANKPRAIVRDISAKRG